MAHFQPAFTDSIIVHILLIHSPYFIQFQSNLVWTKYEVCMEMGNKRNNETGGETNKCISKRVIIIIIKCYNSYSSFFEQESGDKKLLLIR